MDVVMRSGPSKHGASLPNAAEQRVLDIVMVAFEQQESTQKTAFLNVALQELDALPDASQRKLLGLLPKKCTQWAGQQTLLLNSFLFYLTKSDQYLKDAAKSLFDVQTDWPAYHYLIWQLRSTIFRFGGLLQPGTEDWIREHCMRPSYLNVLESIQQCISNDAIFQPRPQLQKVGIIVPQLLGVNHAPSLTTLTFVCGLQQVVNLDCQIINTNMMPITRPLDYFGGVLPNSLEQMVGEQRLHYNDPEFGSQHLDIYSDIPAPFSLERLVNLWNYIESRNFDVLVNLGDDLFTTDYFLGRIPILNIPLQRDLPLAMADQAVLVHETFTAEETAVLETHYSTRLPETGFSMNVSAHISDQQLSRTDFGLPKDAFVYAIVGNRLGHEIDAAFLGIVSQLLEADNRNQVVFVGDTAKVKPILEKQISQHRERLFTFDHQNDLSAFYGLCDAYLNPKRSGGGVSSQMALARHLPVLTLDYGDVAAALPKEYCSQTYNDLLQRSIELCKNPDLLAQWQTAMATIAQQRKSARHNIAIIHRLLLDLHQYAVNQFESRDSTGLRPLA